MAGILWGRLEGFCFPIKGTSLIDLLLVEAMTVESIKMCEW